jgi:large subunit ribosomal protein L21
MFAVIRTGGKQYKVKQGDVVEVELLEGAEAGKSTTFSDVLLVADGDKVSLGKPLLAGAKVEGEILSEIKGEKVISFKFRRRHGYHRTVGHRQKLLKVKISSIAA